MSAGRDVYVAGTIYTTKLVVNGEINPNPHLRVQTLWTAASMTVSDDAFVQGDLSLGSDGTTVLSGALSTLQTSASLSAGGAVTAAQLQVPAAGRLGIGSDVSLYRGAANELRTDNNLVVSGSTALRGAVVFGSDSAFTYARAVPAAVGGATSSTFVLGQSANGAGYGGDLAIDAGTGSLKHGALRIGSLADSVSLGQAGKTVSVLGALAGTTATLSALTATTASLSTISVQELTTVSLFSSLAVSSQAVTADTLTVASALSATALTTQRVAVTGSAAVGGSLLLGTSTAYTLGRPATASATGAAATHLLGQASTASTGGNLVLDAGTGVQAGQVRVGTASESVVLGASGKTTMVPGVLSAASLLAGGAMTAASLSVTGAVSVGSLSNTGPLTTVDLWAEDVVASGTLQLLGSMQLGGNTVYSIARAAAATPNAGRSTFVLGQTAGHALSVRGSP